MATTTTNFGWDIPQSTDLVKDGATAIAALGQDIDTALVDLKGGTTGQVLAKATGTDLDFSWVTQDDANAIQNTQLTAKGALISAVSAGTPATLTVGTNGQVLTADSTTATGLKWASGAWITWSPTISNISIGNGTVSARYQQTGNVIFFSVKVTFGSTTTISGSPSIPLPVVANSPAYFTVNVTDSGVASYTANGIIPSSVLSTIFLDLIDTTSSRAVSASFSSTSPFTWGTNDNFTISGSYEVA